VTGDLVNEVAVLDRAREAVSAGASERALAALDEYDRRFGAPTLTLESQVLRIEALAQKGERERAARLAEAFLVHNPSSAHVARVRSLLLSIRNDQAP
jgi:outer membrane protein assembly factor BamD (BamD/ComL family)